ncbi:TetR/AcrR family transcriptional regulator [Halioxenophilus sp. WMMB6]|uniref:TetR/AcrR family transcriptional regulator n=1 Tax=Halioxenophilus sp. WMMB6 TaxID=3073815 RepID=UPI00295EFE55|nr:TetR/AcrR family transcriptional regulator [Halioxenophilus sp. WMMB6]
MIPMGFIIALVAEECKAITANQQSASRRPGSGRPTKEEAARRHEQMLEMAIDSFLEAGFENTRVIDIATSLGMSKRTVYAYYKDKDALFIAAVKRLIERYTVPLEALQAVESDDVEETLCAVARIRIANVATPTGIKLQRILSAQSHRFPELLQGAFMASTEPTMTFLCDLFKRLAEQKRIRTLDPDKAATAFLSLVVGGPARLIVMGGTMDEAEVESRVQFSVDLFLNGLLSR